MRHRIRAAKRAPPLCSICSRAMGQCSIPDAPNLCSCWHFLMMEEGRRTATERFQPDTARATHDSSVTPPPGYVVSGGQRGDGQGRLHSHYATATHLPALDENQNPGDGLPPGLRSDSPSMYDHKLGNFDGLNDGTMDKLGFVSQEYGMGGGLGGGMMGGQMVPGAYGGGPGYLAATAAVSAFVPIMTVFLGRQSRGTWTDSNTWAAIVFASLATLLKLFLDMHKWDLSMDRNKRHAFTYGALYMLSVVFMIVAGFLIIPTSSSS
jgi:hypothetical protein